MIENNYPHLTVTQTPDFNSNRTKIDISFKVNQKMHKKVKGINYPLDTIGFEHIVDNDKLKEVLPIFLQKVEEFRIKKLENGDTSK